MIRLSLNKKSRALVSMNYESPQEEQRTVLQGRGCELECVNVSSKDLWTHVVIFPEFHSFVIYLER